jgi:ribosome maturation protein SDO1
VLPLLQARFPIQRARMRLKLQVPQQHQQALLDSLDAAGSVVEGIEQAGSQTVVVTQVGCTDVPLLVRCVHEWFSSLMSCKFGVV